MPKRKRITRHDSEEVQGEGSWVKTATLTVAEMRESRKLAKTKNFDAFELGVDVTKTHVLEWNWVGDDGEPLPQVPDHPEVVDTLTDEEIGFLGKRISGSDTDTKN